MGLWVMCGSYASSQVSSGTGVLAEDEVEDIALSMRLDDWQAHAAKLVEVGLWERVSEGYLFHDWGHFRQGGDERRKEADRMRKRATYVPRDKETSATSAPTSAEILRKPPQTSAENSENLRGDSPHLRKEFSASPIGDSPHPTRGSGRGSGAGSDSDARELGHQDFAAARVAYGKGIEQTIGNPYIFRDQPEECRALEQLWEFHGKGKTPEEFARWLRTTAAEYAKATRAKAHFQKGYSPTKCVEWLNAGARAIEEPQRPGEFVMPRVPVAPASAPRTGADAPVPMPDDVRALMATIGARKPPPSASNRGAA